MTGLGFGSFAVRFEHVIAVRRGEEDKMARDPRVVLDGLVFPEVPRSIDLPARQWELSLPSWIAEYTFMRPP
jgi:hypothetical protein